MVRAVRLSAECVTVSFALVVIVVGSLTLAGCAKKTRMADDGSLDGPGSEGYAGEEGLSDQSSLGRARQGLEPEEDGVLKDVRFAYDSYDLDALARDVLAANAQWLKENPGTRTEIEGHCDERGTIEYNLALGARRAKAAKDYLVSLGVSADRLSTISYGEELPLCRDASESCYVRNRRVHFIPPSQ